MVHPDSREIARMFTMYIHRSQERRHIAVLMTDEQNIFKKSAEKFVEMKFCCTFAIPSEKVCGQLPAGHDFGTVLESWQSGRMRRS